MGPEWGELGLLHCANHIDFHAREDSPAAHSALCGAIAGTSFAAHFTDTQWHFVGADGGSGTAFFGGIHPLTNLFGALSYFDDDHDTVHLEVAQRGGSFEEHHRRGLGQTCDEDVLVCDTLPTYDPTDRTAVSRGVEVRMVAAFVAGTGRTQFVRTREAWDRWLGQRLARAT